MSGCTKCNGITLFRGEDGNGIDSIAWTSNSGGSPQGTQGTTDTYTITYDDATTATFVITNGADGTIGVDGVYGGWSSEWSYDGLVNDPTSPGIAAGDFILNNGTPGDVSEIYIHDTNADSAAIGPFLDAFENSGNYGLLRISKKDDPNVFWMGIVTGVTDVGAYHTITVTYTIHNGTFNDNDSFIVSFAQSGADGVDATNLYDSDWITIPAHNGTFGLPAFTNWTNPKLRVIGHQVYITGRILLPLATKGTPTSLIADSTLYPSTYKGEVQIYTGTAGGFAANAAGSITSIDSIVPSDLQPTENVLIAQQLISTRAVQDSVATDSLQLMTIFPTVEFNTSGQLFLNTWKDYLDSGGIGSGVMNAPIFSMIMNVDAGQKAVNYFNYRHQYNLSGTTTFSILDSGAGGYTDGTHTGVTSTSISGVGTGAIFTVVIANNQIVEITQTTLGSGYVDGEIIQLDDTTGTPGIGTGTTVANILVTVSTDGRVTNPSDSLYPASFDGMNETQLGGFLLPFELSYPIDPALTEAQITAAIASM